MQRRLVSNKHAAAVAVVRRSHSSSQFESGARLVALADKAVIVIGSGAGGATVARELVERGVEVVLLEAGRHIEVTDFVQNDGAAFAQMTWMDRRRATGSWLAASVSPEMPLWTVKGLGGSTLHWNGLAYRMQAHEFRARSTYGEIAGSSLLDWPLTLADLAPFYARAERRMGVTGTHGMPAHPATNSYKVLWNGARRLGYRKISNAGLAINSVARNGRPGCIQLGFCNQGCKSGAKWSTDIAEIPPALATGRLDLRVNAQAVRIEHDDRGLASAVVYRDGTGVLQRQAARLVCVAGNAVETPRLLLMSDSAQFPHGMANGSGHVGRHYMRHVGGATFGVMPKPVHMHRGITVPGTVFDEARHDPARGFAGGYLLEAMALAPVTLAMLLDPADWGRRSADFVDRYDHLAGALIVGEELPRADNRVTLDRDAKDALGLPVPCIHVDDHPNSVAMEQHARAAAARLYQAVGATDIRQVRTALATHNMGTARMSRNPSDGVVDAFGRAHEVQNLFVSDGSVFPSSATENPTLTIVALAMRQARRIADGLRRGDFA